MTFLESDFYKRPFCSQKELAEHWEVSVGHIKKLEEDGIIERVEEIGGRAVKYSVKKIMDIEGIKDEFQLMNYKRALKKNKELQEQVNYYEDLLGKIRGLMIGGIYE